MKKIIYILITLCFYSTTYGDITSKVGDVIDGGSVKILGSSFGTKTTAPQRYWSNWDDMSTGSIPTGWTNEAGNSSVETTKSYTAPNAVKFVNIDDDFQQISKDMGVMDTFIFRGKMYLDKSADTSSDWLFKFIRLSSSNPPYPINEEPTTAIMVYSASWDLLQDRWLGGGVPFAYYGGGTELNTVGVPNEFLPFDEWYDFTSIMKRSSAPDVADGEVYNYTNGVLTSSKTDLITNTVGDGDWRYMLMGGTIHWDALATGNMDFKVYYDDFYVDDTTSRVELCSSSTIETSGHCEVQLPVNWGDGEIDVTVNTGIFEPLDTAYLIVFDASNVPSPGFEVTVGATPPTSSGTVGGAKMGGAKF